MKNPTFKAARNSRGFRRYQLAQVELRNRRVTRAALAVWGALFVAAFVVGYSFRLGAWL